ncbi:hypothetical protein JCM11251_005634 [Rhodosporidiobolus azoricus]
MGDRSSSDTPPPAPKAPRVKAACARCFGSKVKCDGQRPCSRCTGKGQQCYYDPAGNSRIKRRRRPSPPTVESTAASGNAAAIAPKASTSKGKEKATPEVEVEEAPVIRQPFFRWLGLTSIMPPLQNTAFRPLSVAVQERTVPPPLKSAPPHALKPPSSPLLLDLSEAETKIRTFYALFESYLPYMPLGEALDHLKRGTFSEIVLLSMSALVKRVRPDSPGPEPEELAERAKALVIAHLAAPSLDTTYALLLLAYHEHGEDRDSGLWAWGGMAMRAAVDLGLHKRFDTGDAAECALRSRIFWAVACLDRILSCGCGRLTTIPRSQIEIDLPPSRDGIRTSSGEVLPDPFPTLCHLLLISGDVSDAVNAFPSHPSVHPQAPISVQLELAQYQATLPPPLHFSIQTFNAYVSAGYSQAFLLLSIWHQAVHLIIHDAALLYAAPGTYAPEHTLSPLSGSGAISIADMLAYSSVQLSDAFLCSPTLSQPILMAGRAASALLRTIAASPSAQGMPTAVTPQVESLERSVAVCQKTLERIQQVWLGLSWHVEAMTKSANEVDFSSAGATIVTEDRGLYAKAKLQDLAKNCSWLLDELQAGQSTGEAINIGLSSWGVSSQPVSTAPPPQSTVAVLRSGRSSPFLYTDPNPNATSSSTTFNTHIAPDANGLWAGDWTTWPTGLEGLEELFAMQLPPTALGLQPIPDQPPTFPPPPPQPPSIP